MVKAVLFDMDGVLAFTEQFYNRRRLTFLAEHGIVFDEEPDWTGANDNVVWGESVPDPGLRERLRADYVTYADEHPTPWNDLANDQAHLAFSLLSDMGVRVAICSSSWRSLIEEFVDALDLRPFLSLTISGAECPEYKPAPDIYLTAMDRLDVRPNEVVVVEDSPIGIQAGKAAGAFVCAMRQPAGVVLDQAGADVVIDELSDVVNLVREANGPLRTALTGVRPSGSPAWRDPAVVPGRIL